MNPTISIIAPVYNVEPFLAACIDSVLGQTYKDFELILVNDGSTDGSGAICDDYATRDDRMVVIHKENGGQSSARNCGLDVARGEYIGFIDSDDWIDLDMYRLLYEKAIEVDADVVACNMLKYDREGNGHLYSPHQDEQVYDRAGAMGELYLNDRLTFSPCNKIYRTSVLSELRFKEGFILEDMDFAYQMMHRTNKAAYIGQALYFYRYNQSSTMRKTFSKKRLDEYQVRKDMYEFYQEHYPEHANEVYAEWFLTGVMLYLNIEKYFHDEKQQYRYLLHVDRSKIRPLVSDPRYTRKKKLLLSLALLSPKLLVVFYRYYWDRVKKEL